MTVESSYASAEIVEAQNLDRKWAYVALFGVAVTFLVAAAFSLFRLGLAGPGALIPGCAVVVAASLLGPLLVPARGDLRQVRARAAALPVVVFGTLASVVLALWLGPLMFIVYVALASAGLYRALRLTAALGMRSWIGLLIIALAAAFYLFGVVNGMGYAGVYTSEQSVLGILNHDTRFHGAIAFLLQNFGVPSIGVDGILPLKYHFGSHLWFASLGRMTGAVPAASYGAGVVIVVAPMLVTTLLLSGLAIDHARKSVGSYILIGLLFILFADVIDQKSYYISESYAFGLIGTLLFLPLLAELAKVGEWNRCARNGLLLGILAIPVLASLKVSVGVLWTFGFIWVALRRFGVSTAAGLIAGAALAALALALLLFAPGPDDYQRISTSLIVPFYYYHLTHRITTFSSIVLPLCLVVLAICVHRGGLMAMIREKSELMVEATAVVTLIGLIPPLLGIPQDSSVWYFLNVGQWWATALLIGRLAPQYFSSVTSTFRAYRLIFGAAILVGLYFSVPVSRFLYTYYYESYYEAFYPNFFFNIEKMFRVADEHANGQLLQGRTPMRYALATFSTEHAFFGSDFRSVLDSSVGRQVVLAVREALGVPQVDSAVYVPPGNSSYWNFENICRDRHNIQVELTGVPSLFGGPPASYNCPIDAYTTPYGKHFESREVGDKELCNHAQIRGIRRVFVLNKSQPSPQNRVLDCEATKN